MMRPLILAGIILLAGCAGQPKDEDAAPLPPAPALPPDELARLRGQYKTGWTKGLAHELSDDGKGGHVLALFLYLRTEPGVATGEVRGRLTFNKDSEALHEQDVTVKKDVSWVDRAGVTVWMPYDDANPKHRALRFTGPEDITPAFVVKRVVYADGTERRFD